MKKTVNQTDFELLRQKAEELIKNKKSKSDSSLPEADVLKIIHELEVHQIELELQNEELIQAKSNAQRAAEKYVELYDFAPTGYFTLDKEGKIIELNFKAASILSSTRLQLKKKHFSSFLLSDSKLIFNHFMQQIFESETQENCEIALITNDDSPRWLYLSGIVDEDGVQCLVNVLDTTEQKQAKLALVNGRKILRTLIDNLPDFIYIKDKDCRKVIANISDVRHIGYQSEKEVLGKTDLELFPGTIGQRGYDDDQKVIKSGKAIIDQIEDFIDKEGNRTWTSTTKIPLKNYKGEITGLVGIGHNITELKKYEEDLNKAKEKAEESDRLKSAFLANMSHEIRTPMNGILGFTELLKRPQVKTDDRQKYIEIIEKSGDHLLSLINDIISISKVESGQIEISISDTNIDEQLEYMELFFKPEAKKRKIRLSYKKEIAEQQTVIQTDRDKIIAILTNLIKNALKFTKKGSIEFGYKKEEPLLKFFIKDTGSGIEPDQLEKIFQRFRQGDEFKSQINEGSGLGLTISKAYVELLGGTIWAESEPNKGSTFYFTIPIKVLDEDKRKNKKQTNADTKMLLPEKGLKILIAEDDESSIILLKTILKKYSNEIISVKTGIDAVEAGRSHSDIDLILMDIQLPEMDGYEAVRQIRLFNRKVVIIAQTAFGYFEDKEKAQKVGCNDYILKRFNKMILVNMLEKHFKNGSNKIPNN